MSRLTCSSALHLFSAYFAHCGPHLSPLSPVFPVFYLFLKYLQGAENKEGSSSTITADAFKCKQIGASGITRYGKLMVVL